MICPHCGERMQSSQEAYQARMRDTNRCRSCGTSLLPLDYSGIPIDRQPHCCRSCRLKIAARARKKYADRRRKAREAA